MRKLTHKEVEEVINQVDPMGLLGKRAPKDEYKTEIDDLLKRRNIGYSRLGWEEIRVVFEYWFYPGCISVPVAQEIERRLQSL
jgi:hypothetical protein